MLKLQYRAASWFVLAACSTISACVTNDYDPTTASGGADGDGTSAGKGGTGSTNSQATVACTPSTEVPLIVVDQFGYLPESEKIAVIRDPQTGFDAATDFTPGSTYALVDASNDSTVFSASLTAWNDGKTHSKSGDKAYWFDFTSVTTEGTYYVLDVKNDVRSPDFRIADNVYQTVLRHALRTFYYQRAGQAKEEPYADSAWVDGPSHVGALQDHAARRYDAPGDETTERDVWGGWYDAGDYNKYTSWTANYVVEMLKTYQENPVAFTDDIGIPESDNGVPDILDEARWGLEYLRRLQNTDGSVLSIVGEDAASPPSAATGQTLYGTANTSGTLATAAAFAAGARVFADVDSSEFTSLASDLADRATQAFDWAEANPKVIFRNNDSASGTSGLGSGQQEVDDDGRVAYRIKAAVELFRLTGETTYRDIVDSLYAQVLLIKSTYAYPFEVDQQDMLLYYADAPGATAAISEEIYDKYLTSVTTGSDNLPAHTSNRDAYLAHLKDYVWGSNSTHCNQGNLFWAVRSHGLDSTEDDTMTRVASRYLHYLHGTNPFGLVYLSNMGSAGATRSITSFYHSWFNESSGNFACVTYTTPGPAPGFLVGGPNPSYALDSCCPDDCGSASNNAKCDTAAVTPPLGQPAMKSYRDFNANWPQNSWSVAENSCGYQIAYIRLLSKYVH